MPWSRDDVKLDRVRALIVDDDYDLAVWNSTQAEGAVYCDSREDYTTSEPVTYAQAVGMLLTALVDRDGV